MRAYWDYDYIMLSILRFILKDATAITAVKLTTAIASLFSLPVVTDALSIEEYARYEYVLLFLLPLQVIIGLNLENGILRFWNDYKIGYQNLKVLLKIYSIIFVVIFVISSALSGLISTATILIILAFGSLSWQSVCLHLRLSNELKIFYIISVTPNIVWLFFLSLTSSLNIETILFSKAVCLSLAAIVGATICIAKRIPIDNALISLTPNQNKKLIKFSVELIPSIVLVWLLNMSDRYLISILSSDQNLALYSLHFRIAMGFKVFVAVSRQTWAKLFFATSLVERDFKSVKTAINMIILCATLIIPIYILMSSMFIESLIVNAYDFDSSVMLAILLSLLLSILYTLCCTMYLHNEQTTPLLFFNAMIVASNYLLSYIFIEMVGIIGAPLGSILSLGSISLYMQWRNAREIGIIFMLTIFASIMTVGVLAF